MPQRHQGDREDHQPRRQSRGVLDQVQVRWPPRTRKRLPSLCTLPAPAKTSTTPATPCKSALGRDMVRRCPHWTASSLKLREMAHQFADVPMLSRTHGQNGQPHHRGQGRSPTWWSACKRPPSSIANVKVLGKMNGAVGNYNAHLSAWPDVRLGSLQPERGRVARTQGPGPDLPALLASRSSRTTTWPSCSTPWPAPTPS